MPKTPRVFPHTRPPRIQNVRASQNRRPSSRRRSRLKLRQRRRDSPEHGDEGHGARRLSQSQGCMVSLVLPDKLRWWERGAAVAFQPHIHDRLVREAMVKIAEKFQSPGYLGPQAVADFDDLPPDDDRELRIRETFEQSAPEASDAVLSASAKS